MLMQEANGIMLAQWQAVYQQYRKKLYPNKRTATDLIRYLQQKFPSKEVLDAKWQEVVLDNVRENDYYARKVPPGQTVVARVFRIEHEGQGQVLYEQQDAVFQGLDIYVGVELQTGYFMVEGSSLLWDELFAFCGLDEMDLNNVYLVAEYVTCLKRFSLLEEVLSNSAQ